MRLQNWLLAILAFAAPLSAQDTTAARPPSGLQVGSRVRIATAVGPGMRVGAITALTRDTLLLAERGGGETAIALSAITSVERSTGKHRHVLKSAGIGAAVGVGVGVIAGLASGNDPEDSFLRFDAGDKAAILGLGFGVVGFAGGAIFGALNPHEGWTPVAVPLHATRSSGRSRPTLGIGLSFALR